MSSAIQAALGRQLFGDRRLSGRQGTAPYLLQPFVGGTISDQAEFLLNANLPLLSKVDSLIPASEYGKEAAGRRRLSTLSGLPVVPVGPEAEKREKDRQKELRRKALQRLLDQK
jgi:hypothetical protein